MGTDHLLELQPGWGLGAAGHAGHLLGAPRKFYGHRRPGCAAQRLGRSITVPALRCRAVNAQHLRQCIAPRSEV